ncbi:MAG TPA: AmmeMemoRadiSam system protein B [Aquifex aeolicus]|uniref:MEMO1 family protein EYH37_02065 n=1 Tax=Aquifex aeolicus TaxID=63363 RepID=A0A9D1CG50_AQUAO|nr:AmmeMemoRadiSam system protein B [Aquificales bacterium]HIP98138.1 AmmeMemoRadiSam system protein B [Aquifex aeolicus]HIQ26018.1 AmmeMemoRadiSam system protein B [Aquifex aeolicus]
MKKVRQPAVAGTFYPAERDELLALINFVCGEPYVGEKIKAKAVLVPHAGYIYSGKTACEVYKRIEIPPRVVLLGPNHTGLGAPVSVYSGDSWVTPLGEVEIDREIRDKLTKFYGFSLDEDAHKFEHSLEVQLPFLQVFAEREFKITPIVLSLLRYEDALYVANQLSKVLFPYRDETLIVISSDMSHYIPAEKAKELDSLAIECMQKMDTACLYERVFRYQISMCGIIPAVVGIEVAKNLGAKEGKLIDYTNSGQTTGDYSNVVAYAGMIFV